MNSLACHMERSGRGFWPRVRGADRQRQFRERPRGRTTMARNNWQRAQNFFEWQRNANDSRGANEQFLRRTAESLRGFCNGTLGGGMACRASGAIVVAGIHDGAAHAALPRPKQLLGNENGCRDNEVLCKDGGGRGRHVARKNREIERAGFLQAAGGRGAPKTARQRGFRNCVLYQRNVHETRAPPPQWSSAPPPTRQRMI